MSYPTPLYYHFIFALELKHIADWQDRKNNDYELCIYENLNSSLSNFGKLVHAFEDPWVLFVMQLTRNTVVGACKKWVQCLHWTEPCRATVWFVILILLLFERHTRVKKGGKQTSVYLYYFLKAPVRSLGRFWNRSKLILSPLHHY